MAFLDSPSMTSIDLAQPETADALRTRHPCIADPHSLVGLRHLPLARPEDWPALLREGLRPPPVPGPDVRLADLAGTAIDGALAPDGEPSVGGVRGARSIARVMARIPLVTPVAEVDHAVLDAYETDLRGNGVTAAIARKVVCRARAIILAWEAATGAAGQVVGRRRRRKVVPEEPQPVTPIELGVIDSALEDDDRAQYVLVVGAGLTAEKVARITGDDVLSGALDVPAWGLPAVMLSAQRAGAGYVVGGEHKVTGATIARRISREAHRILGRRVGIHALQQVGDVARREMAKMLGSVAIGRRAAALAWKEIEEPPRSGSLSGRAVDRPQLATAADVGLAMARSDAHHDRRLLKVVGELNRKIGAVCEMVADLDVNLTAMQREATTLAQLQAGASARLAEMALGVDAVRTIQGVMTLAGASAYSRTRGDRVAVDVADGILRAMGLEFSPAEIATVVAWVNSLAGPIEGGLNDRDWGTTATASVEQSSDEGGQEE